MPALVRDFRGSMQGRAETGLILTTGRFTQEALKEANRDGVPPIACRPLHPLCFRNTHVRLQGHC